MAVDFSASDQTFAVGTADGEVHQATTDDGSTDASARWDGSAFTVWLVAEANVGDVDVTELWDIGSEGSRLTIDRTIDVPRYGEFGQTLLFSRRQ